MESRRMRDKLRRTRGLKDYLAERSDLGEKDVPEIFVGRSAEILSVLKYRDRWSPERPKTGATHLILGAPGAGKTSLAKEAAKRWEGHRGAHAIVWGFTPRSEEEVHVICRQIAIALGALGPDEERTTKSAEVGAGINVGLAKGGGVIGEHIAPPETRSLSAIPQLPNYSENTAQSRRVAVFLDEIQNIKPGTPAAGLVESLHTQHTLPVLLVCSGLADGKLRLSEAETTRIDPKQVHRIGTLSLEECIDCVRRNLEQAREQGLPATEDAINRWAKVLAEESDQWPRHLHCCLTATWETLLGMSEPNLDEADISAALTREENLRTAYYKDRVKEAKTDISILYALTSQLPRPGEGMDETEIFEIIAAAVDNLNPVLKEIHKENFPNAQACLEHLLHVGIVTYDSNDFYSVPIPTMADHIERRFNARNKRLKGPEPIAPGLG